MRQLSYYVGRETQADELGQVTQYDVDTFGRITAVREHLGSYLCGAHHCKESAVTSYAYDALDRLLSITDANKNETEFKWDALNRQRSIRDPDRGLVQFYWNDDGSEASEADANGSTHAMGYDPVGRLTSRTSANANQTTTQKIHWLWDNDPSAQTGFSADRVVRTTRFNLQRKAFVRPSLRSKRPC